MNTPELKPCPFCGSEADMKISFADGETRAIIFCKGCSANIQKFLPNTRGRREDYYISTAAVLKAFSEALDKWNGCTNKENTADKRFSFFRERIERQINETVCKRDVLHLCSTKAEKARTDGFINGLEWLLEILDYEESPHNEDDEGDG